MTHVSGELGHARILIVTFIDEEFEEARKVFGANENIPQTPYFTANARGRHWDVVVTQCQDRANICSGQEVSKNIFDLRPQIVLAVGIAGGLCDLKDEMAEDGTAVLQADGTPKRRTVPRDGVALGDVIIPDYVDYLEFLKITPEGAFSMRYFPFDQPSFWLRRNFAFGLRNTCNLGKCILMPPPVEAQLKIRSGAIVSGEKILSGIRTEFQQELLRPFPKAIAVDMESAGVARSICESRTSYWYNPHYAVFRGISDLVGMEDVENTREQWKRFAAHAACVAAFEFVKLLPPGENADGGR